MKLQDIQLATSANQPLGVSQLFVELAALLEDHFPTSIYVRGQISGFNAYPSGHWYFSIKDNDAQLNCVMFKRAAARVREIPQEGDMVILSGKVSFYERQGRFQLMAEELSRDGVGDIHRQFEELKKKLHAEGLFNTERKQALPPLILRLCVITSKQGAALHDVMKVLQRRMPCIKVYLLHTQVQGEGAAEQIIEALQAANRLAGFDAILITRGGGSAEDLNCFNEESLVRAVSASSLPVVTAIGHEIDTTLCDLAADKSSPTPSAAAEELSIDSATKVRELNDKHRRMQEAMRTRLDEWMLRSDEMQGRLSRASPISVFKDRLRDANKALNNGLRMHIGNKRVELSSLSERFGNMGMDTRMMELRHKLRNANTSMLRQLHGVLAELRIELRGQEVALNAVSPMQVLARGYALALNEQGQAVRDAANTRRGDLLKLCLARGRLDTQVQRIYEPLDESQKSIPDGDEDKVIGPSAKGQTTDTSKSSDHKTTNGFLFDE